MYVSVVLAMIVYLGMARKKEDIAYTFEIRICGRSLIFCTTPSLSHHTHNKQYSHIALRNAGPGMLLHIQVSSCEPPKAFAIFFLLFFSISRWIFFFVALSLVLLFRSFFIFVCITVCAVNFFRMLVILWEYIYMMWYLNPKYIHIHRDTHHLNSFIQIKYIHSNKLRHWIPILCNMCFIAAASFFHNTHFFCPLNRIHFSCGLFFFSALGIL